MITFEQHKHQSQNGVDVYDDGLLRVEHDNYYVLCNKQTVHLPRTEFLVISRLVKTPERFVAAHDLWQQVWGNRKPFNAVSLHVYIYRLRRRFESYGIKIETMIGVGYRFVPTSNNSR